MAISCPSRSAEIKRRVAYSGVRLKRRANEGQNVRSYGAGGGGGHDRDKKIDKDANARWVYEEIRCKPGLL
jgi:hypothetical protein